MSSNKLRGWEELHAEDITAPRDNAAIPGAPHYRFPAVSQHAAVGVHHFESVVLDGVVGRSDYHANNLRGLTCATR